ncbi:aminotransferase class I/II-fold pyridoxal phosphate-dependent enzyme, partial [Pseudomonas aeruginosa]|uniref:aminotransferase class I/II-fold pyridoxal phosphate-dependent enzyme n=1 Tax=Pseudomonas aeruginosa TaxID=287 RepID=UPI0031B69A54
IDGVRLCKAKRYRYANNDMQELEARLKEVVEWLRQRSRPYLFSNSLAPAIVAASIKVLEMVEAGSELRDRLWANARQFREQMSAAGFTLAGADHAIIPVM